MLMYIMIVCTQTQDCHSVNHFDTFTTYFNTYYHIFFVNLENFLRPMGNGPMVRYILQPWCICHAFVTHSTSIISPVTIPCFI
jgi:uncharacterized membrane protein